MTNAEIAKIFRDIGDLLDMKGENVFKVRAYQKAARAIEYSPAEMEQLLKEGKLEEVPGVGEAIARKIAEMITTGRLKYYEELRAEFPPGISELMDVPGVGPRRAMQLSKDLGVTSVAELEQAIQEGKVAHLFRMGEKTAENILRHIQTLRTKERRIPVGAALPLVDEIIAEMKTAAPGIRNLVAAGSLRRFKETVGDIDLMGTADDAEAVLKAFTELPQVKEVLGRGATKASVVMNKGLQVDLRVVDHDSFGSLLQYFTGSKDHNVDLRGWAERRGLKLSEYGITDVKTGLLEKFATEEDFYRRLGLQYIPPEIREARDELERAEKGTLPGLVEVPDIRGDLHVHSKWSDGHEPIEEMVAAARERGYEYIAITDHSAGRGIARGLVEERLRKQMEEIRALNEKLKGIRVLTGAEVDIRADGSLDYPDELLADLDIVVASVHSSMEQESARMTARVIKAIENPNVDILGHPSCRLLGEREPVQIDMESVFRAAAATRTALEINAMPDRLDLKDVHAYRARELGVPLVISTDAHRPFHLDYVRYGVGVARRAWCEAKDILNTRPRAEFVAFLAGR